MANHNKAEKASRWAGGLRKRNGYVYVMRHDHPLANKEGYVMRAVLVWEEAHNKPFPKDRMPHHKNLVKDDDRAENIVPLTMSQHMKIHAKLREINKILREAEANG